MTSPTVRLPSPLQYYQLPAATSLSATAIKKPCACRHVHDLSRLRMPAISNTGQQPAPIASSCRGTVSYCSYRRRTLPGSILRSTQRLTQPRVPSSETPQLQLLLPIPPQKAITNAADGGVLNGYWVTNLGMMPRQLQQANTQNPSCPIVK